jgi:hypothetical protein
MKTDYTRTAAALEEFDRMEPEIWRRMNEAAAAGKNEDVLAAVAEEERLGRAVGRAFGEDSKAFNNPKTCEELVRPGPSSAKEPSFVRKVVARWKREQQ